MYIFKKFKEKGARLFLILAWLKLCAFFGIKTPVQKFRLKVSKRVDSIFNSTVAYGHFKGLKFAPGGWWGVADRGNMILGLYEKEVLNSLMLVPDSYRYFIDLGAADGYYAIGVLVANKFEKSICFEASKLGQKTILKNADLNKVSKKIVVNGFADSHFYSNISQEVLDKSVLFIDIEGGEFELINENVLDAFSRSIIFIELHDWLFNDSNKQKERLIQILRRRFEVTTIVMGTRGFDDIRELDDFNDDERWIMCSEGRGRRMEWLRLDPKCTE